MFKVDALAEQEVISLTAMRL